MLFAYYWDIQKQSSGEFAKFIVKQLCQGLFLKKVTGGRPIKIDSNTVVFKDTSGGLL